MFSSFTFHVVIDMVWLNVFHMGILFHLSYLYLYLFPISLPFLSSFVFFFWTCQIFFVMQSFTLCYYLLVALRLWYSSLDHSNLTSCKIIFLHSLWNLQQHNSVYSLSVFLPHILCLHINIYNPTKLLLLFDLSNQCLM